jgi:hypothetical protein
MKLDAKTVFALLNLLAALALIGVAVWWFTIGQSISAWLLILAGVCGVTLSILQLTAKPPPPPSEKSNGDA